MQSLNLIDSDIAYYPRFIDPTTATAFFDVFRNTVPWQQDDIKVFGKIYPQPRLTAFYGNKDKTYSYANITMQSRLFSEELIKIKALIENKTQIDFNACLLNLYRNGKDSNGWHSDDEKELGDNPIIASISLGENRFFHLRHKKHKELRYKLLLEHGSLLLMKGETQHHWHHQLPKTAKQIGERINLTFRVLK
ncbi:alpha-ketoglutarate-dependent dioxygenase AlkB family protein [Maribacter luteus]|uniref:Alpha-ketoglutarate-dependent dioxygenase AlkB n=1 Tax=Maribacter luteus TaxID=2594478 RepID=A0A6I2MPF4_9FLAO|nr:alpha-ketoglutarate-dependent dioxygenase AlkB [Maribacter luteus]MRX65598.1 alpha-ketoglutarate-dependent dioxygenase AlkB [Maribacter luteus]